MRAYRIAYDGRGYHGFQRQPTVPTVEDALFDALRSLGVLDASSAKPPGYAAAGRTDARVSALAQTVAFDGPEWLSPRAFNAELPADIRAWASADVQPDFHATHHAQRRTYTYHLHAPPEWIADERLHDALEILSGRHDFHNFTPDDEGTVRSPHLRATRKGPFLEIRVVADGFARELVRRLVSLATAVGRGAPLERIHRAFDEEPLPGHEGIAPAPPEPLVLTDVTYPDCSFQVDQAALEVATDIFERRRVADLVGTTVMAEIQTGLENATQ